MDKKIIKFDDTKIKKYKFHKIKLYFDKRIDINKIVISNKLPFHEQDFINFIGYKDDKKVRHKIYAYFFQR